MPRLRALLATARIANVPSVVSNVWLGFMLGWFQRGLNWPLNWSGGNSQLLPDYRLPPLILSAAGVLIYLAGSFLNDWADRTWDAAHRPERALPAGRFPPAAYLATGVVLAFAGLALAFAAGTGTGLACTAIVALVVIYTSFHKRSPAALPGVAACRGLLVVAGFLLTEPAIADSSHVDPAPVQLCTLVHRIGFVGAHALGVFAWTLGISLVARHESLANPTCGMPVIAKALLVVPLAAMSCWWIPFYPLAGVLALLPLAGWLALSLTALRHPARRQVAALLAGLPLVDLVAALPLTLALIPPRQSMFDAPLLATGLIVPAAAFALGLALQRLAPPS